MRNLLVALVATAAVLSTGALTTRSDAMTIAVGSGLNALVDTAGVDQVHYYGYGYRRGYYGGYRGYYGGYRGYYGGYRGYRRGW
jgi:hypothetical protein